MQRRNFQTRIEARYSKGASRNVETGRGVLSRFLPTKSAATDGSPA